MIQAADQTSYEQLNKAYGLRASHCQQVYAKLYDKHTRLTTRLKAAKTAVDLAEKEYLELTPQNWMQSKDESPK